MDRFSALRADLVDLVDVDDADLGALDVEIGGRDELQQDVLNVFAHIARFGKRGGVGDGKRHLQRAGKRLRKQRFARTGGAQQHDVRLRKLDVAFLGRLTQADALVVVVHGHGKRALGRFLTHHVLGKLGIQLVRRGKLRKHHLGGRLALLHLRHNRLGLLRRARRLQPQIAHHGVGAHGDALVADIDAVRAGNHGRHLVRMFAAEGADDIFRAFTGELIVVSIVHVL